MTEDPWWHGTPHQGLSSPNIEPRDSVFRAVFLTRSISIAAFYAGSGGIVHEHKFHPEARLFDTTPETGTPFMSGKDLMQLDELCSEEIDGGFLRLVRSYFPRGTSSWTNALLVLGTAPQVGVNVLRKLGYDGFIRNEQARWAWGDRPSHALDADPDFEPVIAAVKSGRNFVHRVAAVVDTSVIFPTNAISALDVARSLRSGQESRATQFTEAA